ncbi:MAG: thioredoxin [Thermoplasmata archaeon]|nr:MAG: thioredoxin [Thermoplasmata archaeon]
MSEIEKIKQKMLQRMMSASKEEKKEMPKKPIKITDENFDEVISKYDVVVVDFYADWCGPCRMLAPVIEELAKEMKGKVVFAKLNTDENPKTAMKYRVMSIPTLIMFKNGKMVDKNVGALPADMLRDWIERYI